MRRQISAAAQEENHRNAWDRWNDSDASIPLPTPGAGTSAKHFWAYASDLV